VRLRLPLHMVTHGARRPLMDIKNRRRRVNTMGFDTTEDRPMSADAEPVAFDALDACHRQIHDHLGRLTALAQRIDASGIDGEAKQQAGAIERFFSETSRDHHAQEERSVFPPLLGSSDAELVAAVRTLQQDHGWIEENWIELAPQLRAIANDSNWVDPAEFQHAVEVFVELCNGHIALEESLIYPESKARWADRVAGRRASARS
jgi:hemerythrin-like domain-containing protein